MEGAERGERRISLFYPSMSKAIEMVVGEYQKPDLGSIARVFGLDPNTLKLNGYFISRGADLVASSLTWHSLIRYFSSRALPAGASTSAAILVDGKLSRVPSKRLHEGEGAFNVIDDTGEVGCFRARKRPQHEHCSTAGSGKSNGSCLKRKWRFEGESNQKRARSDEGRFSCSIISSNLKRMRIDEIVAAAPCKKLR